MNKIQMEVIPEPEPGTASILVLKAPNFASADPYAIIRGPGNTDYVCGSCRATIVVKGERGQIINVVFKCGNCGAFNIIRGL